MKTKTKSKKKIKYYNWAFSLCHLTACWEALKWAAKQPSAEIAWKKCKRLDWMMWLIDNTLAEYGFWVAGGSFEDTISMTYTSIDYGGIACFEGQEIKTCDQLRILFPDFHKYLKDVPYYKGYQNFTYSTMNQYIKARSKYIGSLGNILRSLA